MAPGKDTSSVKGGGKNVPDKTPHSSTQLSHTTQSVLNLGENGQKREFIGIKIKATDTPEGRKLSIERATLKTKRKSTEGDAANQANTDQRDNNTNTPRRSGRQRRPAWKTVEREKSETLKCTLKFQNTKSESNLTKQKNSKSMANTKCLNSASLPQIPPPKGGDATQGNSKKPHETRYPCSTFSKPDYSLNVRQSKKKTKFQCSSTCLRRSPGGAKERAKRYISRKRKRRSAELLGKYRKKKLRSNRTNDLWEGFPFNLQMPRNNTEQEHLQRDSQSSLEATNKDALGNIATKEDSPAKYVQDEQHRKDKNAENGHAESSNLINNLTFTITTGKKRKRRHRKRKKHRRSSPNSEQRTEKCPATESETYSSKTHIPPSQTDSCTEAGIYHLAVDPETTRNKSQHNYKIVSKSNRNFSVPSEYDEALSTSSGSNRKSTKGKKGDTKANSRAEAMSSQTATGQCRKKKQKWTKKSPSVDTTVVTKEATATVSSIKLAVTKADIAGGVNKEGVDDHKYKLVVSGVNWDKQIDVTANSLGKEYLKKSDVKDQQINYGPDDTSVISTVQGLEGTNPREFKEERAPSQVRSSANGGYCQLLLDPSNRRPLQNSLKKKAEFSSDPVTTIVQAEIPANKTNLENNSAPLNKSDILFEASLKLDTFTDAVKSNVEGAQIDETSDKYGLNGDASFSEDKSKAVVKCDDLFCPEDEQADGESDCEKIGNEFQQKKKFTKNKSSLKVKLPFPRFAKNGNRGERAVKEVSSDEESAVLSASSSSSSNTQKVYPLPSPNLQHAIKTTPKKTKCRKLSNDSKSNSTNAPLMQKSRKECTDWRLLSPSSKHRNVRRVSSEGKIPNNPVPSTSEKHKRTTSNDQRKCTSSSSETKQGGFPVRSRPVTRRQSLESNTESLLEGLLLTSPKKQVPAAHSQLFDDKRLGIHACSLWSSGNRRHYQLKNPDASGEELDRLMRTAWGKLSQREKLQYYKRASNATTDQHKSTPTTATHKKAAPPPPKPLLQQCTLKPTKPLQDPFYTLPASLQEDILLHKLKYFQKTLSAYHYNRFLYEFITSFKRSVRNLRSRKAEWLDDPVERGVQFAIVSRRMLYNKMKQYEGLVAEILQHRQFLAYKHHKLKYDDVLWKIITGGPAQFDDSAHSDRLTLLLEAIEDVEQNINRNPVPHQDHGRGEPSQASTCLCGSEGERRAVQEIAEDLKHSCSTSGSTRVRINNTDVIIPRVAIDSRLNQQLLSELDHSVSLQELGAEDVGEYLDSLATSVPDIGDELVLELAMPLFRVSTPQDGLPAVSTPLDGVPSGSTPPHGVPRVSTPLDRTPLDGMPMVSTTLDGMPMVSTSLDGMHMVPTPLDGTPRVSTPLDGIPRVSTPLDGMSELELSPLEEAWAASYRSLHGLEQCCPLDSPSCILSSLLVDQIMAAQP